MNLSDIVEFKRSTDDNNFVGLKYVNDKVNIFLPLGYNIYREENRQTVTDTILKTRILLLLKSISLVKSIENGKNNFGNNNGTKQEIPFNSFLWIINDYLNNGIYQEVEKKYVKNTGGKINWKKTISGEHYFSNNNVTFINPFYETTYQKNNIISELNKLCVKISSDYIGFLFGRINIECDIITNEIIQKNKIAYINIINNELLNTFNDRKKQLLIHIKRIIEQSTSNMLDKEKTFGTYRYEYVWEYIVNDTLGTEKINLSSYFPEAFWNIINKNKEKDKSKLRPDAILKDKEKNRIYILDAKYYKYGITGLIKDLPHIDSIQKQITYGDHIFINNINYGNVQKNDIYNAFIIPYNKENNIFDVNNNISYLGFAECDWKNKSELATYEKVALILIDTKFLLDSYYKKEKNVITNLIEEIEKVNNK